MLLSFIKQHKGFLKLYKVSGVVLNLTLYNNIHTTLTLKSKKAVPTKVVEVGLALQLLRNS